MNDHNAEIVNSILIDEYSKCVFDSNVKKPSFEYQVNNVNAYEYCSEMKNKWKPDMNVRAIYSKDKEYYEAVIKTIIDDRYAIVRFIGYENEEVVHINNLQYSKGETSIRTQLKNATIELELTDDENCEHNDEIEWKSGMLCRALYDENNVIYEATVLEIDEKNGTALLNMTGFNKNFVARFEEMYKSIPEYRIKQENVALKIAAEKLFKQSTTQGNFSAVKDSQENIKSANDNNDIRRTSSHIKNHANSDKNVSTTSKKTSTSENSIFENSKNEIYATSSDTTSLANKNTASTDSFKPNESGKNSHTELKFSSSGHSMSQCQEMVHPETESDALACLVSSNYLSGYYAGYYDCMKKFQNQRKSEE